MIRTFQSLAVFAAIILIEAHPVRALQTQTQTKTKTQTPPSQTAPAQTPPAQTPPKTETRKGPPESFKSSAIEQSYAPGGGLPSRRTQTRTESNGREVVSEVEETVGIDGKMKVSRETASETVRTAADSTQTKQSVYAPDGQGRRQLIETTQVDTQTLAGGASRSVANTWTPDLNGRLSLAGREIQEVKNTSPNVTQTDTTIFRPGANEPLLESERLKTTERKISKDLTQTESVRTVRDGNGRWQTSETRNEEVKVTGNERVAEATVSRATVNGTLAVAERTVTKQTTGNDREESVTERYVENIQAIVGRGGQLQLSERVRSTTSFGADGSQQTTREVEERNPVAPNGPMRVTSRTVDTIRQVGPNQWELQRQVFALDGNGKLVPVLSEKGRGTGK